MLTQETTHHLMLHAFEVGDFLIYNFLKNRFILRFLLFIFMQNKQNNNCILLKITNKIYYRFIFWIETFINEKL